MAKLNNTQYIEDPREQGLLGLSGVRPNRFQRSEAEELGLSQASLALNPGRSMTGYRDDVYRSTPSLTFMGTPGLGDSRFDDKMAWASEFLNLDDSRGKYQSGFELIGLGVLKGAVLAGTTFLDGLVGTPMGLISMATGGSFVLNPWSMAMQSINQWSEEAMPNYYREHELNSPWYQNIFTANMLGDKLLKNLGFAVGAAYSGRVNAGMLSKTLNMGKVRQAYKGAVESAVSGKPLPAGASPMNVVDDLAKGSAGLAHRSSILKMAGSLSAGMGEGRIEAIGNADEYRLEKEAILNEELDAVLDAEKYKLMQEPGAEQYFTITEGIDGVPQGLELTPEGYNLIYERHREAHELGLAQINKDASRVANVAFATNTALLTASDWIQFGKFYAGGYRNARKAASVGRLADGTYAPTTNKIKEALTYIKNPLVEANEEMMQAVSGIGAGYMYNHESYLDAELDPESNRLTMGYIKAMGKAILEQYGDVDNWEEGFIGGIIGAMGVPSFGGIQGGIAGSVRENREAQRYNKEISDALNRAVTPEMVNYYKGLVQNNTYENLKEEALQNDDIYKYKNHEADLLISSIITFSEAGRIQDLIEIIEGFGNVNTPEEIAHIKEITTNKETGKSIYNDMQDSEIAKSIKNQVDLYKRFINDFSEVSEDLLLIANKDHTAEGLKELTWMSMKVKDWEHRFNNMYKEAREALGDLQVLTNEGLIRLASDILALSPYEFMANALPQMLIDQLAYASETEAVKKAFRELRGKNGPIGELQALIDLLRQRKEIQGGLDSTVLKLQDLLTTIINRALYGKRLYDFMNNPQALQEKQKKVKEKAVKNQEANNLAEEAKEDVPTTEALKGAQTLSEFKDILNSFELEDTHEDGVSSSAELRRLAIADRLSKQDNKIAMAYMDIHNTATAMIENIERDIAVQTRDGQESLYATDSINMAKRIVDEMSLRVEDGTQLRSLDEALVNDIIDNVIGRDNEFFERESALGEVLAILKEAVRLIDSADGAVNFINKARANQKSKVNTPGALGNLKIPSSDEVLGRKEKKQEEAKKVEPEAKKQLSSLKSIPEGLKSSDIGNQMEKRNTATQWPSERNPLQYWKPSFSEHDTASLKANNPIAFKDREGGAPIRAIWDVLAQNGAWKYVNEGNLKVNDTISFGIDPKIMALEGIDGVPIFMYKGDLMVGLMPATGAPRYKEMQLFIEGLMAEYETFLNENPDKAKERFISRHTSYVTDVLAGRGLYSKANRLLSKVKNINNRPITFSYVNSGVELTPNIEDAGDYIGLSSTQDKEGMLFYRQLGADGKYYPVAINIKHFNDKEFSLSDESNQSTGVYRDLRLAIQGMYDHIVDDKGGFASSKDILNSILYFGGELSFFATTTNREGSVEINIKNDKGEKIHQAFVMLGSKPRPITSFGSDGSMTLTKQTENTLVERDAFIDDVLRVLLGFNPRFQVNGNMLNTPGYNESLVNDGILFTNLMDAIPGSAWFKAAPVKPDGTVYSEKEMGNTTPPTKKNVLGSSTLNTVSGSETVATHVEVSFRGVTYKINKDLSFGPEVPVIFKAILEDLALIKMASQGIAPEGTKVSRNREAGLLRLKRPDNSVVWFSLKSDRENIKGVPQPAANDVGYLDQAGSQEAEAEYIKSIGEDAYNELMGIKADRERRRQEETEYIESEEDKKILDSIGDFDYIGKASRRVRLEIVKREEGKVAFEDGQYKLYTKENIRDKTFWRISKAEFDYFNSLDNQGESSTSSVSKENTNQSRDIKNIQELALLHGTDEGYRMSRQAEGDYFTHVKDLRTKMRDRGLTNPFDVFTEKLDIGDGKTVYTYAISTNDTKRSSGQGFTAFTYIADANNSLTDAQVFSTLEGMINNLLTTGYISSLGETSKTISITSALGLSPAVESLQAQESGLIHYPEYDDTSKEGVKDWVPIRRAVVSGGNRYANTFGKKVEIPGFESFDFYVVPAINNKNKYIVIEGSTGLGVSLDSSTIKGAVVLATERLNQHGLAKLLEILSQTPIINEKSPSDTILPRVQEDVAPKEEVKTPLSRRPGTPPANMNRFSKIAKGAGIKVNENFKDESTVSTDLVFIDGRANPNASFEAFSALAKSIAPKSNGARLTRSDWNSLTAQEREHEINCIAPF